jgi:hypothetical protein
LILDFSLLLRELFSSLPSLVNQGISSVCVCLHEVLYVFLVDGCAFLSLNDEILGCRDTTFFKNLEDFCSVPEDLLIAKIIDKEWLNSLNVLLHFMVREAHRVKGDQAVDCGPLVWVLVHEDILFNDEYAKLSVVDEVIQDLSHWSCFYLLIHCTDS